MKSSETETKKSLISKGTDITFCAINKCLCNDESFAKNLSNLLRKIVMQNSVGDTVGIANITTSTDTIITTLTIGIITGSNSAIVYSVDTSGIVGFFTIENLSGGGVKISSASPPDGNNNTSGYNSLLIFDELFVTPLSPGVLSFTANIDSELKNGVHALTLNLSDIE